jgi:hypothetical protein
LQGRKTKLKKKEEERREEKWKVEAQFSGVLQWPQN